MTEKLRSPCSANRQGPLYDSARRQSLSANPRSVGGNIDHGKSFLLGSAGKTLVMVEHDMSVVFDLADRISVLVYGELIASGTPAEIRANAAVQEAYLGTLGKAHA